MSTDAILAQGTLFAVSANESPPSFSSIPESNSEFSIEVVPTSTG